MFQHQPVTPASAAQRSLLALAARFVAPGVHGHVGLRCLLGGWLARRRALQLPMRMCARAMAFALGYHWLTVVGRPAYDTAPVLVANHISFVDPIVLCAVVECSFLAASEASIDSPHVALRRTVTTLCETTAVVRAPSATAPAL